MNHCKYRFAPLTLLAALPVLLLVAMLGGCGGGGAKGSSGDQVQAGGAGAMDAATSTLTQTGPLGYASLDGQGRIVIEGASTVGGQGAITRQWYLYNAPPSNGATGTPIPASQGGNGAKLVYTAGDTSFHWFSQTITDGTTMIAATSTRSDRQGPSLPPGVSVIPSVPSFAFDAGMSSAPTGIVLVGDSISDDRVTAPAMALALNQVRAGKFKVVTTGHSGTTWAHWLPNAPFVSGDTASLGTSHYDTTKNNFQGALQAARDIGADSVSIMLGTNSDGLAADEANAQVVVNAFVSAGMKVLFNGLPYRFGTTQDTTANYLALETFYRSLVNNTTVFAGTDKTRPYGAMHEELYTDDTHPGDAMRQTMGKFYAEAYLSLYYAVHGRG